MHDQRWDEIERELKRDPVVDPAALDQIMSRVRASAPPNPLLRAWRWLVRPHRIAVTPLHGLAAAAVVAALLVTPQLAPRVRPDIVASLAVRTRPQGAEEVQKVQFVYVAADASGVSLVGDFNNWDPDATRLQRSTAEGVWSVVVPLRSGRYLYAFVVDGETWMPDAAAPRGPEDEFGGPRSVLLVGENT